MENTKYFTQYLLRLAYHFDKSINLETPIYMCVVKTGGLHKNTLAQISQKKREYKTFTEIPQNKEI